MKYLNVHQGQALRDLERAFKNFLTIKGRGFPKFKKKGKKDSFYLEGSIKILKGNYIKLPRIGIVKTYEILPSVPVKNVRISKHAGNWYVSFKYDLELTPLPHPKSRAVIGVDVGINALATCSDGSKFANVKAYRQVKKTISSSPTCSQQKSYWLQKQTQSSKKTSQTPQKSSRYQSRCTT